MRLHLPGVMAAVLLIGAQGTDDEVKKLQGIWAVVSAEVEGEKKTADEVKSWTVTIKDKMLRLETPARKRVGKFTLDPSQKPKAMNWTGLGTKGAPSPYIYELNGDTLKLCWREPGGERPTEFTGKDTAGFLILKKK
jgi:uncharacterized protein (TIGR03067 family)